MALLLPDIQVTLHLQLQAEALWPITIDTDAQAAPFASILQLYTGCATSAGRMHALLRRPPLYDPMCPYQWRSVSTERDALSSQLAAASSGSRYITRWAASTGHLRAFSSLSPLFDLTTSAQRHNGSGLVREGLRQQHLLQAPSIILQDGRQAQAV